MCTFRSSLAVLVGALILASCDDGTGPGPGPTLDCTTASVRSLAVGQHVIIDPLEDGACVRLPAAGADGAKHLYVPVATAGNETADGVSEPYLVQGGGQLAASARTMPSPRLSAFQQPAGPEAFHSMLRNRERALVQSGGAALFRQGRPGGAALSVAPVADTRTFQVCATSSCNTFVQETATLRSLGQRVAIYLDDAAPANGYTQAELDDVRQLFDEFLYPIDTTAFGRESDIDANNVVVVLLTQRVNQLSGNCNTTKRVILGYFFGADLLPMSSSNPGSNEGEVFYGLVPDPDNSTCTVDAAFAREHLPATFIHEFQHMISFNQHVLVRGGPPEDTWLNEGLSHFAEELGGRQVPDVECPSGSCFGEFIEQGDLSNAFEYLASPEDHFLIEPGNSTGTLEERGANWLMLRWLADHFANDTILGTDFTRKLLATSQVGSGNVEAQTGESFSTLVGQWQLANYLDDLPGFSEPTARLRYKSWNFRGEAEARGISFPLEPDSTSGVSYSHSGVLRAGSGHHILVAQDPSAAAVDLKVTTPSGTALPSTIEPRVALVRVH